MSQDIKVLNLKPIGQYADGSPQYSFSTSCPTKGIRAVGPCSPGMMGAASARREAVVQFNRIRWPCGMGEFLGVARCGCGCRGWIAVVNLYATRT